MVCIVCICQTFRYISELCLYRCKSPDDFHSREMAWICNRASIPPGSLPIWWAQWYDLDWNAYSRLRIRIKLANVQTVSLQILLDWSSFIKIHLKLKLKISNVCQQIEINVLSLCLVVLKTKKSDLWIRPYLVAK